MRATSRVPPPADMRARAAPGSRAAARAARCFAGERAQPVPRDCASATASSGQGVGRRPRRGADGAGRPRAAARGVGALAADFYLRTGYMPLRDPNDAARAAAARPSPTREIRALVALRRARSAGPRIPQPRPERREISATGLQLFTEHCAGCHQVVGEGGIVTGARVPPLERGDAAADRGGGAHRAVRDAAVLGRHDSRDARARLDRPLRRRYAKHPDERGGWAIGHLGPVPEGMVAWVARGRVLLLVALPRDREAGER